MKGSIEVPRPRTGSTPVAAIVIAFLLVALCFWGGGGCSALAAFAVPLIAATVLLRWALGDEQAPFWYAVAFLLLVFSAFFGCVYLWPSLQLRSVVVLVDASRSMEEETDGMAVGRIREAKTIVERNILRAASELRQRELVYPIVPDFNQREEPKDGPLDRESLRQLDKDTQLYSDYLGAVRSVATQLQDEVGQRYLFVVGDLIHQSRSGPDPRQYEPPAPDAEMDAPRPNDPPAPGEGEKVLFSGVHVFLIYPDASTRPYADQILPFWRAYLGSRGLDPSRLTIRSFASVPPHGRLLPSRNHGLMGISFLLWFAMSVTIRNLIPSRKAPTDLASPAGSVPAATGQQAVERDSVGPSRSGTRTLGTRSQQ